MKTVNTNNKKINLGAVVGTAAGSIQTNQTTVIAKLKEVASDAEGQAGVEVSPPVGSAGDNEASHDEEE